MTLDLEALKAAALAATPGPWSIGRKVSVAVYAGVDPTNAPPVCVCDSMGELPRSMDEANAAHMVASCPSAVLALVERLKRAEQIAHGQLDAARKAGYDAGYSDGRSNAWSVAARMEEDRHD